MVQDGSPRTLNDRCSKAVPVISTKVLEMNTLIEQMIEAARLEDGALMLRPEANDLRELVKAAVNSATPVLDGQRKVRVKGPERPVRGRVDGERVKTIVANLVSNAIKYSPEGGPVQVDVVKRGGIARVSVKDHGVGIAKDDLPILFTRFGRVSTPETDHLPGTGLGLYLGRQLARLHGGEITVDSDPGRGSTFTLHLPAAEMTNAGPGRSAHLRPQAARLGAVDGRNGDKVSFFWEGEPEDDRRAISFRDLQREVVRFANGLKKVGIKKGTHVGIYMGMIPELPVAMLACTRIGAPFTVVFGGFSGESLSGRLNDMACTVPVTPDEGTRRGHPVPLNADANASLSAAPNLHERRRGQR